MDESDRKILDLLRENARMSYSEIGNAVGISRVSVKKRITAMEEAGIIRGYHTVIDQEQIRKGIRYTIDIEAIPEEYAEVVKALQKDRELEEIYSTTGESRIHCVGRSVNSSTMESHVNYLFNHTKGIRKIGWHILMSDLKAGKGSGDGTVKEKSQGF
ncbi:MAG: Lrp/AsnC family transcriptional regulator [Eubacteriales bacterium]|nr:Lrp/AsnC family transcriptional regulator [Eubacteriales bacterium]